MSPAEMLWRVQCRLNRRFVPVPLRVENPFVARGASLDLLGSAEPLRGAAIELCVIVTTYDRPAACAEQLAALHAALEVAGRSERSFVLVFVDASSASYTPVLDVLTALFPGRFALYEAKSHLGKRGFWRTHQSGFAAVRALGAPFALFLQDDLTFERSLVRDAFARWDAIDDDRKAVLSLIAMDDDEPNGRWIAYPRRDLPAAGVRRTQWFDLPAFLAHRRFFELLGFEVFPVPDSRWSRKRSRSSGVGEQFTRRLFGRANVYQVSRTLVYHGEQASLMNPEARAARQLDNRPGSG